MAKRILIVDDSPTETRLVVAALQDQGYQLITASDGEQALERVVSDRPDLILLDVVMPKMNGYQVCRHLKSAAETRDIKVLMLTSKSQDTDRFWGMRQGADGYLTKPFSPDELAKQVGAML